MIGRDEIRAHFGDLGRTQVQVVPRQNVQGFHLRRDPHGLVAGILTLRQAPERIPVAEDVPEAEREWLVSVGNALLRR